MGEQPNLHVGSTRRLVPTREQRDELYAIIGIVVSAGLLISRFVPSVGATSTPKPSIQIGSQVYTDTQTVNWSAFNLDPGKSYVVGVTGGTLGSTLKYVEVISGESFYSGSIPLTQEEVGATEIMLAELSGTKIIPLYTIPITVTAG